MVEKYAILDALEELRADAVEQFVNGDAGNERTFGALVALQLVAERVNQLPVHLDLTKEFTGFTKSKH